MGETSRFEVKQRPFITHTIHHPYIWLKFMVNVGKYTIHGCYWLWQLSIRRLQGTPALTLETCLPLTLVISWRRACFWMRWLPYVADARRVVKPCSPSITPHQNFPALTPHYVVDD